MTSFFLAAALLTVQPLPSVAAPESAEATEAREAIQLANEEVAKYVFFLPDDRQTTLRLRQEPILRWTNHLRRRFYGDVFIWTHKGRPEAVATITTRWASTAGSMRFRPPFCGSSCGI